MERYPRFRRLRFAPPAVMHGLPSPMAPRCGRRGVWQYAPLSISQKPRKSQKGDWLTQIKQIDRIIGTYLRNQREIIPVTRCERTLTETAESAEVGDRLTQIHWIYKIFLRKSAISARDYPCHLPCHTPIKVDELGCFGAFCKMTLWWRIIIIWRRSRRLRRISRSCADCLPWCRSEMLMIRWS